MTDPGRTAGGCDGHGGLAGELRALAVTVLDRIEPALDRMRREEPECAGATCAVCPFCAVLAAVRGERPELAVRLADQAVGLVEVLRTALIEGAGAPTAGEPAAPDPPAGPRVQRIPVERR